MAGLPKLNRLYLRFFRISFSAQSGAKAIVVGEHQFPQDSPLRKRIVKRTTAEMYAFK
jgi:hypothetical protein